MKKTLTMILAASALATALADSTCIEFFDPTGAVITSKIGWKGAAATGEFFIETPNDGKGVTVKRGEITAEKFIGDGSALSNLPAAQASWDNISSKPSTFAPAPHTHPFGEVNGLQTALDGKASLSGAAFTGTVTVNNTLRLKLNSTHATWYDSTGAGGVNVLGLRVPSGMFLVQTGEIQSSTDIRAIRNVIAQQDVLVGRNIQANGTVSATLFSGDGSSLSNVTPATHSHTISEVNGLSTALADKASLSTAATHTAQVNCRGNLTVGPSGATVINEIRMVTGTIAAIAGTTGITRIDFPAGFNRDNCVILSCMAEYGTATPRTVYMLPDPFNENTLVRLADQIEIITSKAFELNTVKVLLLRYQ